MRPTLPRRAVARPRPTGRADDELVQLGQQLLPAERAGVLCYLVSMGDALHIWEYMATGPHLASHKRRDAARRWSSCIRAYMFWVVPPSKSRCAGAGVGEWVGGSSTPARLDQEHATRMPAKRDGKEWNEHGPPHYAELPHTGNNCQPCVTNRDEPSNIECDERRVRHD